VFTVIGKVFSVVDLAHYSHNDRSATSVLYPNHTTKADSFISPLSTNTIYRKGHTLVSILRSVSMCHRLLGAYLQCRVAMSLSCYGAQLNQ
jgi:hypothetical protein